MSAIQENQTLFASEQPVFQEPVDTERQTAQKDQSPQKKRRLLFIVVAGSALFFLLLLMVALSARRSEQQTIVEASPTPEPQTTEFTQLGRAVKDVETLVNNADPTNNEFPFPPIEFNIFIQKTENTQ